MALELGDAEAIGAIAAAGDRRLDDDVVPTARPRLRRDIGEGVAALDVDRWHQRHAGALYVGQVLLVVVPVEDVGGVAQERAAGDAGLKPGAELAGALEVVPRRAHDDRVELAP